MHGLPVGNVSAVFMLYAVVVHATLPLCFDTVAYYSISVVIYQSTRQQEGSDSAMSKIEWTNRTWNPVTGCTKVSPGCAHCYAETFSHRLATKFPHLYDGKPFIPRDQGGTEIRVHPDRLSLPREWPRRPSMVFVNSMSDLFHEDVPDWFIFDVLYTIETTPHTYQVLTKRAERMQNVIRKYIWDIRPRRRARPIENLWLGVSVENDRYKDRIAQLRRTPAAVRFLSCEPLLGDLGDLELQDPYWPRTQLLHWIIVGGESGARTRVGRRMRTEWARGIRDQAVAAGVPFFFKQQGAFTPEGVRVGKARAGRLLDGREWNQYPEGQSGCT